MPRFNRNLIFLVIAIVLGVLASMMAVRYINHQVAVRTRVTPPQTRKVVVPVHDMEQGANISAADVAARDVPLDFVPADALTPDNYAQYMGQQLRSPLTHGAPIPGSAIDVVTDHFSNLINPGQVAFSMQVDETNSISGLIAPGDRVDILLLMTDTGDGGTQIRPLLGNITVLATGKHARGMNAESTTKDGIQTATFSDITLALTPQEVERLGIGMKLGEVRVMLRGANNYDPFNLSNLTKAEFLGNGHRVHASGIQFIIGGNG